MTNDTPKIVMNPHDVRLDAEYAQWIAELKHRYRSAQVKASVRVNGEKLLFNWELGRDLVQKKAEERWGAGVVEQVSLDLRREFPDADGFSERNLRYMKQWYLFYTTPSATEKLYQLGRELPNKILLQPIREKLHQAGAEMTEMKLHQLGAEFPLAFALVPWRHHVEIISKCKTLDEALFYILKTINGNWSRINENENENEKWRKLGTLEIIRSGRMRWNIVRRYISRLTRCRGSRRRDYVTSFSELR